MNPFLPVTMWQWLTLAAVVVLAAILLVDMYRMAKSTNVYENKPIPSDELRAMIPMIVDDGLRANVQTAVIDSAAHHPITREVYDKIVSRTKSKAIAAEQVALLSTAGA